MMTSQERVKTVLDGGVPDRVPFQDAYWATTIERWRKEGMPVDVSPEAYFGCEIVKLGGDYTLQLPVQVIEETERYRVYKDSNGATRKDLSTSDGWTPSWLSFSIRNRDDWEIMKERARYNPSRISEGILERYRSARNAQKFISFGAHACFHPTWQKIGMEQMFIWMQEDPEFVTDLFETHTQLIIDLFDGIREMGVQFDGAWLSDDLGYVTAPLISPQMYRDLVKPYHKRLCDHFAEYGLKTIFHSDGNVGPLIPDFIDAGFRALNPLEAKAHLNVSDLKKEFGTDLVLFGNIDVRKLAGTRDEIEEEVKAKVGVGKKDGGYIFHSDHSVPNDVSLASYKFALEMLEAYGSNNRRVRDGGSRAMVSGKSAKSRKSQDRKMKWWRQARFGMFIHWGLYAIPEGIWKGKEVDGIGEWIMHRAKIPVSEYEKLPGAFNPVKFNAREWVKLAKQAGMKYLTITSKHHDGFALFKSEASPYNIVDSTPFKRDVIEELAKECKKADLKLCFYYSQKQDWHHPHASGNTWDFQSDEQDFTRYMKEKALPQVREILTQYGPIGMIWYDTPQDITQAQTKAFVEAVYDVQPNCLVNGRAGHDIGDYRSMGDNMIPPVRLDGDWETPATLNDTWGFKRNDKNWKPVKSLIYRLVDIVSKGGNYLLNVGPTAKGVIPKPSVKRLQKMGRWLRVNGEAVYGASASPSPHEQSWGTITSRPGHLYLNFGDWPGRKFKLYGLQNKVKKVYLLSDRKRKGLPFKQSCGKEADLDILSIKLPRQQPEKYISVVALKVKGEPRMDQSIIQHANGSIVLEAFSANISSPGSGSQLALGRFGTLENWFRKDHRLSWDVKVVRPGTYDVVVISQTEHGGKWEGGHKVTVSTGSARATRSMRADEKVTNPQTDVFRKDVHSRIGQVDLKKKGTNTVTFRADSLNRKKELGLKLRAIHLTPA